MITYKTKLKLSNKERKKIQYKNSNNSIINNQFLQSSKKSDHSNFSVSRQKMINRSTLNTQSSINNKKIRPKSSINMRNNIQNSLNSSGLIVNKFNMSNYKLKTKGEKINNSKNLNQKNYDFFGQTNCSTFLNENDDFYNYNTKNRASFINYRNNYVLNITRMVFSKYKLIRKRKRCKSA